MLASRSLSLTRSSARPRMTRRALGEGRGDGQDRIFVDHRGRPLGRHLDAGQRRASDAQVGHRLAAVLALVLEGDVGAHLAQAS